MQTYASIILYNIRDFIKSLYEKLMKEERDLYLQNNPNTKGNGYYKRSIQSFFGKIVELLVPRTRDCVFKSQLISKNSGQIEIERLANTLFKQGVSTRNIESILKDCFGVTLCHTTVSKLATVAYEKFVAWKMRTLKGRYAAIYIDAFYFPLKRDNTKRGILFSFWYLPFGSKTDFGVLATWRIGGSS